ncbi:MAG: hypothetical protein COV91_01065 [Candidatus Taylorbacteria bacterium CG11_big_fil_rev_8_21_14_0_20_46_11]|uniref:UDP-glucose/GDP-mannose dehydrogenase dimerization n=1 Tax=Candidatus Taylorbacteria bacterium CG11_big_fil_rev_8_21_14_0_20_46_11 TaxID=1975025 RepID=A0A2H0KCW8_9BACT|nr:MAG: hypothetical protein COV91_01065 [Candidatus Taylorbacteria bacterium CG11_big_fil_rev_8_21_14_0_20_46_11]
MNKKSQTKKSRKPSIGFIGQGFIGKNYADDFERRGFLVTRYAMEEPYRQNKDKIKECDVVFIAVPTPTTPQGFDFSIIRAVLPLIGKGKIAVIKSTMLPGTTALLQKEFPGIFVFHSPEFLREKTASYDAAHPDRNIVGIPRDTPTARLKAKQILEILPPASSPMIVRATEAELIKYGGNNFFYVKVVYVNMLFDLATQLGCRWDVVKDAMIADPRIGASHMEPVHQSGHVRGKKKGERGAGGHCFIKDFAAFALLYERMVKDPVGNAALTSLAEKNSALLRASGKDLDLLEGVYGAEKKRKYNVDCRST